MLHPYSEKKMCPVEIGLCLYVLLRMLYREYISLIDDDDDCDSLSDESPEVQEALVRSMEEANAETR